MTLLLLTPNPWAVLGLRHVGKTVRIPERGVHCTMFFVLTLLMHASRWRVGKKTLWCALVGYGIMTELLQWFVPPRTVEWPDAMENIAGIALGTLVFRLAGRVWPCAAKGAAASGPKLASFDDDP